MSADIIRRLIDAGTPSDLIADVAAALALAEAERSILAKRRENERTRKARSRDVTGQSSCHVTSQDTADNAKPLFESNAINGLDDTTVVPDDLQGSPPLSPPSLPPAPPSLPPLNPPTPISLVARAMREEAERDFADWWAEYPHKVGRPAAFRSFVAARRKADMNTLMDGLARYVLEKPPDRSWCNPATWLNQERWNDQPAFSPPPRGPNGTDRKPGLVETGLRLVAELEERERVDRSGHEDGDGPVLLLAPRWR